MDLLPVRALVHSFIDPSDGFAMKSRELISLLLDASPEPFSRHQFTPGHITCTGRWSPGPRTTVFFWYTTAASIGGCFPAATSKPTIARSTTLPAAKFSRRPAFRWRTVHRA